MSMNQNDDIRYLDIGLPEDIARLKAVGDIDNALRLIDMHLADPNTTAPLAACMRVQREIMLRLPRNYPYTFETAMACIRKDIPDFTEDEFHALEDMNKIGWIFITAKGAISSASIKPCSRSTPTTPRAPTLRIPARARARISPPRP